MFLNNSEAIILATEMSSKSYKTICLMAVGFFIVKASSYLCLLFTLINVWKLLALQLGTYACILCKINTFKRSCLKSTAL